jgi:pimeloyl-ACP methyl ester carboxylesterase
VDVVFVHGLQGDALKTWQREDADDSWPKWLAGDLPKARVWSLGYEASPFRPGAGMSIRKRAINAIALFEAKGIGALPIVYVCHSLGGLLVKQMVRQCCDYPSDFADRLLAATRGIVFLATPHSGSATATWADRLSNHFAGPLLKELRDDTSELRDLNQWYRNHVSKLAIKHQCYSETKSVHGLIIVDADSSDPGIPDLIPIPMDEDHISICKPSSRESTLYLLVRKLVIEVANSWAKATLPPPLESGSQPAAAKIGPIRSKHPK